MARVLGYGGIANTNGARSFSGKTEAEAVIRGRRHFAAIMAARGMGVMMWMLGVFSGAIR